MKKKISMVLAVLMAFSLMACQNNAPAASTASEAAQSDSASAVTTEDAASAVSADAAEGREFTDSVGRTVTVPENVEKIAVSGPLAQIVIFALCPDKMVGVANSWDPSAEEYFDEKYFNLPELGQLYGGKGELNLETLLASGAEVVIDVGEPKGSVKEDLDALQEQTGIPFVHITATTDTMGDAYRQLGELVGMTDEAEKIAAYCDETYANMKALSEKVEKKNLLYVVGENGLNVIAQGSYHAEIIDMMANNLAVVEEPSSKGTGNEVDMEQILNWNPDVVIFGPDSIYATAPQDATWQQVKAIQDGAYYEAPFGPYNWMGFPPSVQRYLGMMWMAQVLYPEDAGLDLYAETAKYFEMFYHCELTQEQFDELTRNSLGQ